MGATRHTAIAAAAGVGVLALAAILLTTALVAGESGPAPDRAHPEPGRGVAPSATPDPDARYRNSRWLLPNVRSLTARDLQITGRGENRRLRFAAWLANDGPGPLLVEPRVGPGCPPQQRAAKQLLHVDTAGDGVFQGGDDPARREIAVGCMVDHPTHDHWHFDAMARYALTTLDGSEIVASDKVSFCLRDNRRVPGSAPVVRKEYFGECERHTPQGVSPGWIDVYDADTPGLSLRLPVGLSDGVYCLTLEADPDDRLVETDETDNATAIPLRIVGTNARTRAPDLDLCADAVPAAHLPR